MRTEMTGRNVYEVSKVASVFAAIELMATSRGRCISRLCDTFTGKSLWQHVLLIAKGALSRDLRDGGSTFIDGGVAADSSLPTTNTSKSSHIHPTHAFLFTSQKTQGTILMPIAIHTPILNENYETPFRLGLGFTTSSL